MYTALDLDMVSPGGEDALILVADDDPDILDLVVRTLEGARYRVIRAIDGAQALALAREHEPDLLVLDVSMPGIDGFEVCRRLQSAGPFPPPVIFLTAFSDTATRVTGLDSGAVDYVVKPFEPLELVARVRAALRTKAARDRLAAEATTDGLTGLANRRQLDLRVDHAMALARRHRRQVACLMIDVDHFKRINDTYGHAAGDTVLREVANRIRSSGRVTDVAGRYGGEEFILLLPETDAAGAMAMGEKIRHAIASEPILISSGAEGGAAPGATSVARVTVRVSVGVAAREPGQQDREALYAAADAALYEAKRQGRDRVVLAPALGIV